MGRRQDNKRYQVLADSPRHLTSLYPDLLGQPITDAVLMGFYENQGLVLFNYVFTEQNYFRFREMEATVSTYLCSLFNNYAD